MTMESARLDIARRVRALVRGFAASPANAMAPERGEPAFAEPLVGFAAGDDPLWERLRADIGEFLWTPAEALALAGTGCAPEEISVAAWVLPQTEATMRDQAREKTLPSRRWAEVRLYGERVNEALRAHVVRGLEEAGIAACAPALLPEFGRRVSARYGFASTWSERHAAYLCGLGTFSLSDGLITDAGKAVRVGSVVFAGRVEPSGRSYCEPYERCLFFTTGKCLACAKRCPAGAIGEAGHDKEKCSRYIRGVCAPHVEKLLGERVTACGLCQAGVPCAGKVPTARQRS